MTTLFYMRIPVEYHSVKKNNRQIMRNRRTGKMFLGKSGRLVSAEQELLTAMLSAKEYNVLEKKKYPITTPVQVTMKFYFSKYFTKKGLVNKKLPDLSNLYQLPEDCLQKAGIIFDDYLIFSHDGSRRLPNQIMDYLEIEIFHYESKILDIWPENKGGS